MDAGWRSGHHTLGSIALHVVEAGPEDGPLLILLHGFPEFWWAWRHQITPLAEQGYHVVVPDMRGYNASDAPREAGNYRLEVLADDIVALADRFGADRFRVVGHDWGGVVAWELALSHPDRLEQVVAMNAPHPDLWRREALRHPTQALRSAYAAFFQLPRIPEVALRVFDFKMLRAMLRGTARDDAFAPGEIDRYVAAWSRPGALTTMLNYYRALPRRPVPDPPRRCTVPALILWGVDDAALGQHVAHSALDLCDDGRLVFLPEATHWLHLEEPERVNAELIAFLGHDGGA